MRAPRRTLFEHIFERGRIVNGRMIQIEADTWVVMREYPQYPKAVIQGFKNTAGEARFMVLTWDPIRSKRRLVDVYTTLFEAEKSVPWPGPPDNPGPPYQSPEAGRAERERRGGDGNGYAGAMFDRAEQARKIAERAAVKRAQRG